MVARRRPRRAPLPCLACQDTGVLPLAAAPALPCPHCRERAAGWRFGLTPADEVLLSQAYLARIADLEPTAPECAVALKGCAERLASRLYRERLAGRFARPDPGARVARKGAEAHAG